MKLSLLFFIYFIGHYCVAQQYIAGYQVAKEEVIRGIPLEYINKARQDFNIAYQHTSHGTHVTYGLFGLPDYKAGDEDLFSISRNIEEYNKLTIYDYAIENYAEANTDASDLSRNETAFIQATRNYLDDENNALVNIVMWSWCNIEDHDVEGNYLPGMQTLIDEYGFGGTKIGHGPNQRSVPVHFIFMTGHANADNNIGEGKPKNQADLITNYCQHNGYFCLDYYSIDSYCMQDNYYEDASDDGDSRIYGGNYNKDYQLDNILGADYFENKATPGGEVEYGSHTTQYITSNRKAYAMWWILARLAGWDGISTAISDNQSQTRLIYDSHKKQLVISDELVQKSTLSIFNLLGECLVTRRLTAVNYSVENLSQGFYIALIQNENQRVAIRFVIQR
ncbi:T9SS type A sorting domain-containing protein [Carboxylicivirga marina]|uniref:T9SS type A sorting domain-containing protein n=1 Tax=Carboxylicivirga marina TaxID=2800988 RepID=A0ABS1HFN1_9BACT|nr:T9SS type A sorting domain-containing protein [Carboxylicivirga marina]MBK3516285.1 T9SS type A sorting domain-containing protein [Carboxylicivirga marina]